jgi:WD40 repeat protein
VDSGQIVLRELTAGKERRFPVPHKYTVDSLAWDLDGKLVAAGTCDIGIQLYRDIVVLEVLAAKERARFTQASGVPAGPILEQMVALSANGERLALLANQVPGLFNGATSEQVRVWNLRTGKLEHSLSHVGYVNSVTFPAFSPNGHYLAWGRGMRVALWDLTAQKGVTPRELNGHQDEVNGVAFSADSQLLATTSNDLTVRLWQVGSGQQKMLMRGHTGPVSRVAFRPDAKQLVSSQDMVENESPLRLWDITRDQEAITYLGPADRRTAFYALNATVPRVARWQKQDVMNTDLAIVDLAQGSLVSRLPLNATSMLLSNFAVAGVFSADGRWFAQIGLPTIDLHDVAAGRIGLATIDLYDVAAGRRHAQLAFPAAQPPGSPDSCKVALSRDGSRLAAAWVYHLQHKGDQAKPALRFAFWETSRGTTLHALTLALPAEVERNTVSARVTAVVMARSGRQVALALEQYNANPKKRSLASTLLVVELPAGKVVQFYPVDFVIETLAFDSKEKCIAAAGRTRTAGTGKVWELASGREIAILTGHTSYINALDFSPDGRRLVTASSDRTLKLWEVPGGREVLTLRGHRRPITAVGFSPDGRRIVSATGIDPLSFMSVGVFLDFPAEVKVWDASPGR